MKRLKCTLSIPSSSKKKVRACVLEQAAKISCFLEPVTASNAKILKSLYHVPLTDTGLGTRQVPSKCLLNE